MAKTQNEFEQRGSGQSQTPQQETKAREGIEQKPGEQQEIRPQGYGRMSEEPEVDQDEEPLEEEFRSEPGDENEL